MLGGLAVRRSAKSIIENDMQRLADAVRLDTLSSWKVFRNSWDQVMNTVRQAMTRVGLDESERAELVVLLQQMQQKKQRMETLACIEEGRLPWVAARKFIMNVNNWNEHGTVSQTQFRQDHKDLQMLFALHRHDKGSGVGDKPYGAGGVFGGEPRGSAARNGGDRRKCFNCQQTGHVAANCTKKRKTGGGAGDARKCYECGQTGHIAANCPSKADGDKGAAKGGD